MRDLVSEAQLRKTYQETVDALYAYASRRCGGVRELAEDVTQEVWLRAVREWRVKGIPRVPLAWLTAVARNLILNHLRRREDISLDSVSAADVLAAVDQNDVTESVAAASAVNDALSRIPQAEAQLLEAFHFDRFSMSELASSHGISERAIEGRLRRARERLRQELVVTLHAQGGVV
jgi:RNA polymerase sigma-70 factor (ECF subfamily)